MDRTAVRSFYVESINYSTQATVNSYSEDRDIIPEIKTISRYESALEEAIYKWLEEGDDDSIIKLLQDAKENNKLPKKFYSQKNTIKGTDITCRFKIAEKEGVVKLKCLSTGIAKKTNVVKKLNIVIEKIKEIYNI